MRMEITARGNKTIQTLRKLAKSGVFRRAEGMFLAEGPLLFGEALQEGAPIAAVFTDRANPSPLLEKLPPEVPVYFLPAALLDYISPAETSQGVLFSCRMAEKPIAPLGNYLLLDHLADPGNMGTMLRTADAFAFDGVLVMGGADVYNPKTVRGSMGALFRLPVLEIAENELPAVLERLTVPLYAAVLEESRPPEAFLPAKCVLAIGHETKGVGEAALRLSAGRIRIPMQGAAESLNAAVAAGILCYLAVSPEC